MTNLIQRSWVTWREVVEDAQPWTRVAWFDVTSPVLILPKRSFDNAFVIHIAGRGLRRTCATDIVTRFFVTLTPAVWLGARLRVRHHRICSHVLKASPAFRENMRSLDPHRWTLFVVPHHPAHIGYKLNVQCKHKWSNSWKSTMGYLSYPLWIIWSAAVSEFKLASVQMVSPFHHRSVAGHHEMFLSCALGAQTHQCSIHWLLWP